MYATPAEHSQHAFRVREQDDAAIADVRDRRRPATQAVRVVRRVEIAGARSRDGVVAVTPNSPLRPERHLGERVVEFLVRDDRPVAGREEGVVRPAEVRRLPDDLLGRTDEQCAVVVAVRDEEVARQRSAADGRQVEDALCRFVGDRAHRTYNGADVLNRMRTVMRRGAAGRDQRSKHEGSAAHRPCLPACSLSLR